MPPQANAWLELEPAGQKKPGVQGPLHSSLPRRSAQPKRPGGHGAAVPLTQYEPLGQGAVPTRVSGAGPTVNTPGTAMTGAALPATQKTDGLPQRCCRGEVALPSQKYPASHGPEQWLVLRRSTSPKEPGGHGVRTPWVQKDPGSHTAVVVWWLLALGTRPGREYEPGGAAVGAGAPSGQ